MLRFKQALTSTIGKKFLMSLSGFALVGFIVIHLLGNLSLLRSDGGAKFNEYTDLLGSFGFLLYAAEIVLLVIGLTHLVTAIALKFQNWAARPQPYKFSPGTKGGPSKKNISSTTMIITGIVVGLFLIWHIWQFKYGPSIHQGYITQVKGKEVRDLHRLVIETFHNPIWTGFYVAVMLFLGFHLRHGFWSAFQSAAIAYSRFSKPIYTLGLIIAVILSVGFLFIPLWIFFDLSKVLA